MTDAGSALRALEDTRAMQARLADQSACPPWQHPLFGLLMGGIVAAQVGPIPLTFAVEALCLLVAAGLAAYWRKRRGFFVNGYRRGRTRIVIAGILVVFLAAMGISVWLKADKGIGWAPLAGGAVTFVFATVGSMIWQRVYRAEMAAGAGR